MASPETLDPNDSEPTAGSSVDPHDLATLDVGRTPLAIEDVVRAAQGDLRIVLDANPAYRAHLEQSAAFVKESHAAGTDIYGVTTGVGASVANQIPIAHRDEMALNLLRFHGIGTGRILDEVEVACVVIVRLASLARGYSGVRPQVLERIAVLLEARMLPRMPAEGSVGASGDLTPLSYLAAMLVGEREVTLRGQLMSAAEAHASLGITPLVLLPKESLAIMNGTSAMTGLACLAFDRARALSALASSVTGMVSEAIRGNPQHFDERIFARKAHPGSVACAAHVREHLAGGPPRKVARLQDRYSVRCAPHVIGVLLDALVAGREMLEIEINSVNDNPIVDVEAGDFLHGGNFYGGHVCFVMDGLKACVASVADLLDRQLALLCSPETSDGLPENLVAATGREGVAHHGFKAVQISASALTAEAQKLTMPAAAFSRSTESHNQDKVSMGTIAARDCLRVLELTESVAAMGLLAACQAVDLRGVEDFGAGTRRLHGFVREVVEPVTEDRRQDLDLARLLARYREGHLPGVGRGESIEPVGSFAQRPDADVVRERGS